MERNHFVFAKFCFIFASNYSTERIVSLHDVARLMIERVNLYHSVIQMTIDNKRLEGLVPFFYLSFALLLYWLHTCLFVSTTIIKREKSVLRYLFSTSITVFHHNNLFVDQNNMIGLYWLLHYVNYVIVVLKWTEKYCYCWIFCQILKHICE